VPNGVPQAAALLQQRLRCGALQLTLAAADAELNAIAWVQDPQRTVLAAWAFWIFTELFLVDVLLTGVAAVRQRANHLLLEVH